MPPVTYIHTCIHTFTYIHTHIHTHIRKQIDHTYIPTGEKKNCTIHFQKSPFIHTYIHTYTRESIQPTYYIYIAYSILHNTIACFYHILLLLRVSVTSLRVSILHLHTHISHLRQSTYIWRDRIQFVLPNGRNPCRYSFWNLTGGGPS